MLRRLGSVRNSQLTSMNRLVNPLFCSKYRLHLPANRLGAIWNCARTTREKKVDDIGECAAHIGMAATLLCKLHNGSLYRRCVIVINAHSDLFLSHLHDYYSCFTWTWSGLVLLTLITFIAHFMVFPLKGFMEAPIVTYVGEICQPSIRGVLTACAGVAVMLGFSSVYLLGSITTWRNTALICCCIPITTAIAICFVPETPFWLMAKNRKDDALKSLMWLRGWVSDPKHVEKEFKEIQRYSEDSNRCVMCQKADVKCEHKSGSSRELLKELFRKRTLKPFTLVITMFLFCQFSGLSGMRPYLVQVFQTFQVPIDASWATVVIGILGFAANIACTCLIKVLGKRKIALISMTGTCISMIALAIYSYKVLPPGTTSFGKHEIQPGGSPLGFIPLTFIYTLAFSTSFGLLPVPWMLLSEVFPFKLVLRLLCDSTGFDSFFVVQITKYCKRHYRSTQLYHGFLHDENLLQPWDLAGAVRVNCDLRSTWHFRASLYLEVPARDRASDTRRNWASLLGQRQEDERHQDS